MIPGNTKWRGRRLSTVDLFVLTSWDQLLLKLKTFFLTKRATLMRRSTVLSLPLQLVFPGDSVYTCPKSQITAQTLSDNNCFFSKHWAIFFHSSSHTVGRVGIRTWARSRSCRGPTWSPPRSSCPRWACPPRRWRTRTASSTACHPSSALKLEIFLEFWHLRCLVWSTRRPIFERRTVANVIKLFFDVITSLSA